MGDDCIHDGCPHCGHQDSELRRQVSDIHRFIMGGSEPSRGAVVRLDRLEQNEKRREWVVRAIGGAASKYLSMDSTGAYVELACRATGVWSVAGYSGTFAAEP